MYHLLTNFHFYKNGFHDLHKKECSSIFLVWLLQGRILVYKDVCFEIRLLALASQEDERLVCPGQCPFTSAASASSSTELEVKWDRACEQPPVVPSPEPTEVTDAGIFLSFPYVFSDQENLSQGQSNPVPENIDPN